MIIEQLNGYPEDKINKGKEWEGEGAERINVDRRKEEKKEQERQKKVCYFQYVHVGCCQMLKTVKQTGWQIEANFLNSITRINFEIIIQLEWIYTLSLKLACVNPSEGFKTLATNGLKQSNFLFKFVISFSRIVL